MSSSKSKKNGKIADSRFSNFETDPRFRLPSKKQTKTTIDKRFSRMLKDDSFTAAAKVDRYGRKIKSDSKKKALERLYDAEDGEEEEDDMEVEADDVVERELAKADTKYDPARGGGFSESESESDSSDDDDEEDEENQPAVVDPKSSMQRLRDEQADVEDGEVTNRIAIVNLDWDNIKSADLMALFTSFLPTTGGRIEKVSVYPSEFGKERMQREELEGPPKEIFKRSDNSDDESEESEDEDEAIKKELLEEGDADDFDSDALRKYQLDRLHYYYAVMIFSDKATAQKVYEATDGTEYQSSSNFLDLRFVPDDVTFDDEPRDECEKVPEGYKPVEFVTDALQHSKVKLTWDVNPDDAARKASINRAFTGSRAQLEENDLKAYLASDSEDDNSDNESVGAVEEPAEGAEEPKLSKKELQRRKMREALGLGAEEEKKSKDKAPVGDMEITFTPALTETKKDKKEGEEETTIEKYKRKERERKERKRDAARARREGADPSAAAAAKFADEEATAAAAAAAEEEDLGFDDPFFQSEEPPKKTKTAVRKEERLAKRAVREAEEKEKAEQKAQLQLLMADDEVGGDGAGHLDHFDMNEILRAEKLKKKKGKKGKNKKAAADDEEKVGLQEGFNIDVGDDRFKAVFESHEFAIDPSNPKFKATENMQKLLEEGRKKRKAGDDDDEEEVAAASTERKKAKKGKQGEEDELKSLVASVKRKAAAKAAKK
ncbi:Pre-rRNA-processing protein esf1 [Colletotrichum trifolii]|uniref:Pre-rRNA-processing protein esf1 n=1 Tax=Colletotrichum trifolii TaxID=5466 RepID=A0A4R8RH10_COLTR|nr:Pre-rRNA-processing protein esf1 [Colletotrichum trifolii]